MLKKIFLILFFCQTVYANGIEQCPSVDEIKAGNFNYWLPLYIDGEELASDADVVLFIKNVERLEIARWNTEYLENAHCFYGGRDPIIDKIILAHDAWRPQLPGKWNWKILEKFAECTSEKNCDCRFVG